MSSLLPVVLLLLLFSLGLVLSSPPSSLVCSLSSLSTLVEAESQRVSQVFSAPGDVLLELEKRLRGLRGISLGSGIWSPPPEIRVTQDFTSLSLVNGDPNGAIYESRPDRTSELYIFPDSSIYEYNTSCVSYYRGDATRDPSGLGCLFPASRQLTQLCLRWSSICPDPLVALNGPFNLTDWRLQNPNSQCPSYCLTPGRYNNDRLNFGFQYFLPFAAWQPELLARYSSTSYSWYTLDVRGVTRYTPIASSCPERLTFAECAGFTSLFFFLPTFFFAGPGYGPQPPLPPVPQFSLSYWDAVSSRTLITVCAPSWDGVDFIGGICTDLFMQGTAQLLENAPKSESAFAVLASISSSDGAIFAASQTAYNILFCPKFCDPSVNNGNYDADARLASLSAPLGLADSPYGFATVMDHFQTAFTSIAGDSPLNQPNRINSAAVQAMMPQFTTAKLGNVTAGTARQYHVAYRFLALQPHWLVYAYFAPIEEIDRAASWDVSDRAISLTQPKLANLMQSPVVGQAAAASLSASYIRSSFGDATVRSWNTNPLQTVSITLNGILDIEYSIQVSAPWAVVYRVDPTTNTILSAINSTDRFTLRGSYFLTNNSISALARPALTQHFYFIEFDWAWIRSHSLSSLLITFIPNPLTDRAGCFPPRTIEFHFTFATPLQLSHSTTVAVLSAVVCVFGSWIVLILFEQTFFDFSRWQTIRISWSMTSKVGKQSQSLVKQWKEWHYLSSCWTSLALTLCAIFASIFIAQSQMTYNDASFVYTFNPAWAMCSILPIFATSLLFCISLSSLFHRFTQLERRRLHAPKEIVCSPTHAQSSSRPAFEMPLARANSGSTSSLHSAPSPKAQSSSGDSSLAFSSLTWTSFFHHFHHDSKLWLWTVLSSVSLTAAVFICEIFFFASLDTRAHVELSSVYLYIGAIFGLLIRVAAVFWLVAEWRTQVRWFGAFLLACSIFFQHEMLLLAIDVSFPSSSTNTVSPSNWTSSTLVIIGVVIAAVCGFILIGLQFARLRLSRAKLDQAVAHWRGQYSLQAQKSRQWKDLCMESQWQLWFIHQLRPNIRGTQPWMALSQFLLHAHSRLVQEIAPAPSEKSGYSEPHSVLSTSLSASALDITEFWTSHGLIDAASLHLAELQQLRWFLHVATQQSRTSIGRSMSSFSSSAADSDSQLMKYITKKLGNEDGQSMQATKTDDGMQIATPLTLPGAVNESGDQPSASTPHRPSSFQPHILPLQFSRSSIPLPSLLSHSICLELFKDFCLKCHVQESLAFWLSVEQYKFYCNPRNQREEANQWRKLTMKKWQQQTATAAQGKKKEYMDKDSTAGTGPYSPSAAPADSSHVDSLTSFFPSMSRVSTFPGFLTPSHSYSATFAGWRELLALEISESFIQENAPHQINISGAMRTAIIAKLAQRQFTYELFSTAQREVEALLQSNVYREFQETPQFLFCVAWIRVAELMFMAQGSKKSKVSPEARAALAAGASLLGQHASINASKVSVISEVAASPVANDPEASEKRS